MFHLFAAVWGQGISGKSSHCTSHGSSESGNASQDPSAVCGPIAEEQQQHLPGSSSREQASKDSAMKSLPTGTSSGIRNAVSCVTQSHKVPGESESCKVATQPDPRGLRGARSKYCEGDGKACTALPQRACVGSKTVLDKTLPHNTSDDAPSETSCSTSTSVGKETEPAGDREV